MAWRLLMRRCPSRSMTLVGDVAQTGDLAGAVVLGAGARAVRRADRWRLERADRELPHAGRDHGGRRPMLAAIDPADGAADVGPGRRAAPVAPAVAADELPAAAAKAVAEAASTRGTRRRRCGRRDRRAGTLAVIVPAVAARRAVAEAVPAVGVRRDDLRPRVVVLTVAGEGPGVRLGDRRGPGRDRGVGRAARTTCTWR